MGQENDPFLHFTEHDYIYQRKRTKNLLTHGSLEGVAPNTIDFSARPSDGSVSREWVAR